MKYDLAQQSLEEFVKSNWTETSVQYDNVAFNSDIYTEFCKASILFGIGKARTVTRGCYRQPGVLMFGIFVKPGTGTSRMDYLARTAAELFTSTRIEAVLPLVAPSIVFQVPTFTRDLNEKVGWVMAQVSCPFYYDI